ncbi:MAG: phage tail protein [Pseudomonadota bacterium]
MADFYTILTSTGRAKLANAQVTGVPVSLTHMAVGDGENGAYYLPSEGQTTLKHEVWRGAINSLYVDPQNPNWIVAELVLPDTVGGFYIREVGLFDSAGALIAVGKFPESYKPTLAAGSNKQLYVRMILEVANTSAVTLLVDPSVVLATRQYVDDKVTAENNKRDGKQSVRAATTAAIVLSGLQSIDGVVLASGDRVLVKDQGDGSQNGIYVAAAGAWSRASDADAAIEVTPGLFVAVDEGTTHGDSIWQLVTDGPITLGGTALVFEMLAGRTGAVAGTYRQVTINPRGQVVGGANPMIPASEVSYPGATKAPGPDAKTSLDALAAEIANAITGLGSAADNTAVNQLLNAILSACVQVGGDTMTGNLTLPELRLGDANARIKRVGTAEAVENVAGDLILSMLAAGNFAPNATFDGTNWSRIDTAQPASLVVVDRSGAQNFYTAAAGANPIAWSGPYRIFNETTPVYHRSGSFAVGDGATVNMDISLPAGVWLVTAKGLAKQTGLGVIATVVGADPNVVPPVNQLSAEDYNAGSLSVTTYQAQAANGYLEGVEAGFRIVAVSSAGYPYTCSWYATRLM